MQGELERALARLAANGRRFRVEGAGRTDAGVHAVGQVVAFTYAGRLGRDELERALGALLPPDIGLGRLRRVDAGFRPRYRAVEREYRYFIWNGPHSPLRERYALGIRERLDVAQMAAAARLIEGRHDFSAFGGADRQPVRTMRTVSVRRRGRTVTVQVVGDAFLRQMVRRVVAGLVRVGRGAASVADVGAALGDVQRPAFGGETAPARGLVLWRVAMRYDTDDEDHKDESWYNEDKRQIDEQDIQPARE